MSETTRPTIPKWYWVVAVPALLWNLVGTVVRDLVRGGCDSDAVPNIRRWRTASDGSRKSDHAGDRDFFGGFFVAIDNGQRKRLVFQLGQ